MTARDHSETSPLPAGGAPEGEPVDGHAAEGSVQALAGSEERFHLLVDAVRDYAIFMLDPQGVIATWNTGAQRIKGYTESEIVGQHFSRFYTPEDRAADLPGRILRAAAGEGRWQAAGWRVRKDGTRFWADVTVSAIRRENGTLLGFAKVTRDLTERHAAEELLRQSEERFRLLVEGVSDYAIYMLDPEGNVTSWNTGAQSIKGYAESEIVGQHFSRFYTEEDRAAGKPQRVLDEARLTGHFEAEDWRVRKDGSRFWANVVITPLLDSMGTLRGFSKVTRDLTARRAAEEERRQRLAAEDAARMRAEFLTVAAHELKTPITALRGRTQLALRRLKRDGVLTPDQVSHALQVIDVQTGKVARLVEQLLDVSRLEAGHLTIERRETDLGALVTSVVEMFADESGTSRLQLDLPERPVTLPVDAVRIEQAITNLVENALKYSLPETPIRVRLDPALATGGNPDATGGADRATVSVTDYGPGVPAEDRPRLFDRYFRSHATIHTAGMGLGLYVSRQIVELHGGTIWAEFPAEGGTRMVVELAGR